MTHHLGIVVSALLVWNIATVSAEDETQYGAIYRCPQVCKTAGDNTVNWTRYHHFARLTACHEPMLLDFSVHSPLNDTTKTKSVRVYTVGVLTLKTWLKTLATVLWPTRPISRLFESHRWNNTAAKHQTRVARWPVPKSYKASSAKKRILRRPSIIFAHYRDVSLGVYVGSGITNQVVGGMLIPSFLKHIQDTSFPSGALMQVCGFPYATDTALG